MCLFFEETHEIWLQREAEVEEVNPWNIEERELSGRQLFISKEKLDFQI